MSEGSGDGKASAPEARKPVGPPRPAALWLYGAAFLLLLVSGYLQALGNFRSRPSLVWASIALSGVVLVMAVASVALSGRRVRSPETAATDPGA